MVLKAHIQPNAGVVDDRRQPRRTMQLETSGVLPTGLEANVKVHNLSSTGLLLETDLALASGEVLAIDLPEIGSVDARIVWQSDRLFGCAFADPLDDADLAAAQFEGLAEPLSQTASAPRPVAEPFGARLNRLRRERGLTLAQIAATLDVSKPTVWAWEKGKARPLPERIEAIANALGVSVDDLAESRDGDKGRSVIEDCRLRIAATYGAHPENIRIMIEV